MSDDDPARDHYGRPAANADESDDADADANPSGNGHARSPNQVAMMLAANQENTDLLNRYMAARYAGLAFGGDRDYYETLGYDRNPDADEYFAKYLRNDIARTIVDAPANTSWREFPTVRDEASDGEEATTPFEQAVEYLVSEHRLGHYLERFDKVLGIGHFGVLFLGVADTPSDEADSSRGIAHLENPVATDALRPVTETMDADGPDDLAYLATFSQARVTDIDTNDDVTSPRYGLPQSYDIEFETTDTGNTHGVHHSRVIHAAEDLLENEVYGRPRLEAVLNRLEDMEKVVGGAAEMTWRGADRKLQLDVQGDGTVQNADELAEQAQEMNHGLRNVLRTRNTDITELAGEVVDPSGIVEQLLKLIAGETGIPQRILTGSERGELASTQDRATFYGRIAERQETFCEPQILRPFLDRLIEFGIVPPPEGDGYEVEWPDLFELNELEQAEVRNKNAQALSNAAGPAGPTALATESEIREQVLGWDPERGAEASIEDPELAEADIVDGDDGMDEAEERDALQDILDDAGLVDAANGGQPLVSMTDGGEDERDSANGANH